MFVVYTHAVSYMYNVFSGYLIKSELECKTAKDHMIRIHQ